MATDRRRADRSRAGASNGVTYPLLAPHEARGLPAHPHPSTLWRRLPASHPLCSRHPRRDDRKQDLAPAAVTNNVALLVPFRSLPIGARDLLARRQHGRPMLVAIDVTLELHRSVDRVVEILSRLVVRRYNERRLRVLDVLIRDRGVGRMTRIVAALASWQSCFSDGLVRLPLVRGLLHGINTAMCHKRDLTDQQWKILDRSVTSVSPSCLLQSTTVPAPTLCGGIGPEPAHRGPWRSAPAPGPRPHRLRRCRCRDHLWRWPDSASR
jgi:hypothetical protein